MLTRNLYFVIYCVHKQPHNIPGQWVNGVSDKVSIQFRRIIPQGINNSTNFKFPTLLSSEGKFIEGNFIVDFEINHLNIQASS